jgi:hypothetical protein
MPFFLARNSALESRFLTETSFKINILQASTVMSALATAVHLSSEALEPMARKIFVVDDHSGTFGAPQNRRGHN